jgi:hypothetical protein
MKSWAKINISSALTNGVSMFADAQFSNLIKIHSIRCDRQEHLTNLMCDF